MFSKLIRKVLINKKGYFLISEFDAKAQYMPAVAIVIPFILILSVHNIDIAPLLEKIDTIKIESEHINIAGSLVLWFLVAKLIRFFGKRLENKVFNNGLDFPTTTILCSSSNIKPRNILNKLYSSIESDFDITINDKNDRNELKDIVKQIIVRVGKGTLTFDLLVRYNQARNLIGGFIIATPILILDSIWIIYSKFNNEVVSFNNLFENVIFIIALFGILLLVFSKRILSAYGHEYGHKLIDEYMNLARN